MTAGRLVNLYDLMDSAYDAAEIRAHSRALGHVPIIDVNPRRDACLKKELAEEDKRRALVGHRAAEDPLQRAQRRRTGQRQPQRQPRRQNRPGAWPREGDVPSDVRHSGHHRFSDHPSHRIASRIAARKRVRSLPKNREVDETWPKSTPKCPRRQKNGGSGVATVKNNSSQHVSAMFIRARADALRRSASGSIENIFSIAAIAIELAERFSFFLERGDQNRIS